MDHFGAWHGMPWKNQKPIPTSTESAMFLRTTDLISDKIKNKWPQTELERNTASDTKFVDTQF